VDAGVADERALDQLTFLENDPSVAAREVVFKESDASPRVLDS